MKIKSTLHLDTVMTQKMKDISKKYPQFCAEYLIDMHSLIDWCESEMEKLYKKKRIK